MNGKMKAYMHQSLNPVDAHDAARHIALAVIEVARLDAIGKIESSSYSREDGLRAQTITDALAFFNGPRYEYWADSVEVHPEVLPTGIDALLAEVDLSGYDDDRFSRVMARKQANQIKKFKNTRLKRNLAYSLERLAKKRGDNNAQCT